MQVMPNLEIAEEDINFLFDNRKINDGGESIICKGIRKNTLYKIFVSDDEEDPITMPDNKFKKIKRQYANPLKYSVQPLRTITLLGELIGYEMTYNPDDIPLLDSILTPEETLHCLKETKKILEYYHSNDIIYGDIKDDNILINRETGEISFCDMDNIFMQELPIDVMSQELSDFFDAYPNVDGVADHYMHNLLTLYKTQDRSKNNPKNIITSYSELATMLRKETVQLSPIYEENAKQLIKNMKNLSTYPGGYLIDYVKKEI